MFTDTYELACFVPSRLDGRALETLITLTSSRPYGSYRSTSSPNSTSSLGASSSSNSNSTSTSTPDSERAIIFLHPYAPLGGQFRNNIIYEVNTRLGRRGSLSIAFNLRGAGRSEGRTSWTGLSEQEDLRSILDMVKSQRLVLHDTRHPPAERRSLLLQMQARGHIDAAVDVDQLDAVPLPRITNTLLCGYSYGSMIAAAIGPAEYPQLGVDYAYISFPYSVIWALAMSKRSLYLQRIAETVSAAAAAFAAGAKGKHIARTLFVAGTSDTYTSISSYNKWWEQLAAKALQAVQDADDAVDAADAKRAVDQALTLVRAQNADHSWIRREGEVTDSIESWWWARHQSP